MNTRTRRGISIVELSVVLVIIGLIASIIMGGQELLHQSKLRAIISEYQQYHSAIKAFKLKYNALPGDIVTSIELWDGAFDGDGNGRISYNAENFYLWQHLGKAGFMGDIYSGSGGDGGTGSNAGDNVPASRYTDAAWHVGNRIDETSDPWDDFPDFDEETYIGVGREWYNRAPVGELFKSEDAMAMDNKIDDGDAEQGFLWAYGGQQDPNQSGSSGTTSLSANCESSGSYLPSNGSAECVLFFLLYTDDM